MTWRDLSDGALLLCKSGELLFLLFHTTDNGLRQQHWMFSTGATVTTYPYDISIDESSYTVLIGGG